MGEIDTIEEIRRENDGDSDMKIDLLGTVYTVVVEKRDESSNKVRNKTRGVVKMNFTRSAPKSGSVYIINHTRRIVTRSLRSKPHRWKTATILP